MKKIINNKKGITLIALVVTIVVLLILAAVSISMLSGDNGIMTKAKEAKNIWDNAETEDQSVLDGFQTDIDNIVYGGDLKKLNEFYALGINTIKWFEDEEPYNEGYNSGIDPIPDANTSIIDMGYFEIGNNLYCVCQYHDRYYQIVWDRSINEEGDYGEVTNSTELTMVCLDIYNGNIDSFMVVNDDPYQYYYYEYNDKYYKVVSYLHGGMEDVLLLSDSELGAIRVLMHEGEPYSVDANGIQKGYYTYGNRLYCVTEWSLSRYSRGYIT